MTNVGCEDLVLLRSHQDLADVTHHLVAGGLNLRWSLIKEGNFTNIMEDFFLFTKMSDQDFYLVVLPTVTVVPRTFLQHFISLQYVNFIFSPEVILMRNFPNEWNVQMVASNESFANAILLLEDGIKLEWMKWFLFMVHSKGSFWTLWVWKICFQVS